MTSLISKIADRLKAMNWQLVTAESCTGGLIASTITERPGSSLWFERGFVTYSNAAKQEMLGVPEALITEFGAVSEQVALAMAVGALAHSKGQIALSVTGVAGPDGGSVKKPVGLVCFAWAVHDKPPQSLSCHFPGDRQAIRLASCEQALAGVLSLVETIR